MNGIIRPCKGIRGEVFVPKDKSISHRAVMLGAIADGTTEIDGFLLSKDCLYTIDCFKKMGIEIRVNESLNPMTGKVRVFGKGIRGLEKPLSPVFIGNSGTTIRLLSGILAGQEFAVQITGDASICRRPMKRIIEPLRMMGAKIEAREGGFAPLKIQGGDLINIHYKLPVASAQVKSAILLAGLYADGVTKVEEPQKTRDHTEIMLQTFGVDVCKEANCISINPAKKPIGCHIKVPGDISSAAFFMVGACILPNSQITLRDIGLNPTRTGIIDVLFQMGANIEIQNKSKKNGELFGDITITSSNLKGIVIEGDIIPRLIDEIPVIAVASVFAKGTTIIKDAKELRVKESNRIAAITEGLSQIGAKIQETDDGMIIEGTGKLRGGCVKSFGDHRIAMSLAIAAMAADGFTQVEGIGCVDISYPRFFKDLSLLCR